MSFKSERVVKGVVKGVVNGGVCGRSSMTSSSRCCGSWSTAAARSVRTIPGWSLAVRRPAVGWLRS